MFLSTYRVIKFSIQDIFRNFWLSLVTIIILALTLFSINVILLVKIVGGNAVKIVEEKIDVSLYLISNSKEDEIIQLKTQISQYPEVKEIIYISQEKALENFKLKHEENKEIIGALQELGKNPLNPSLIIKPKSINDLDNLINKLNVLTSNIIETKDFADYQTILSTITNITTKISDASFVLAVIFLLTTLLVIYNTVRIAIYTHRREIMIMRLVGASKWFIQMPYLVSGIIYSLLGTLLVMGLFYIFLIFIQPYLNSFFESNSIDMMTYFYKEHIFKIFGLEFLFACLVNIIASWIAVKKYSKI